MLLFYRNYLLKTILLINKKMENKLDIRVAKKVSDDTIVINKGEVDGILDQMKFLVYEESDEILDPITHQSLGLLENPKGKFKVLHIQEKFTTLISELKRSNKINLFTSPFSDIDIEKDLLKSIKEGDKVKILNK